MKYLLVFLFLFSLLNSMEKSHPSLINILFIHDIYPIDSKWPVMIKVYSEKGAKFLFPPAPHTPPPGGLLGPNPPSQSEFTFTIPAGENFSFECSWYNQEKMIHHTEAWFIKTIIPSHYDKKLFYHFAVHDMFNARSHGTLKGKDNWQKIVTFPRYFLDAAEEAIFRHDNYSTKELAQTTSKIPPSRPKPKLDFILDEMKSLSISSDITQLRTSHTPKINPFK